MKLLRRYTACCDECWNIFKLPVGKTTAGMNLFGPPAGDEPGNQHASHSNRASTGMFVATAVSNEDRVFGSDAHTVESVPVNTRVRFAVADFIRKDRGVDARTERRSRPALDVVRARVGNNRRSDSGLAQPVQRCQHLSLNRKQPDLEPAAPAFDGR